MTAPSTSLPPTSLPDSVRSLQTPASRAGELRAELEAATERAEQALVSYELGHLAETALGQTTLGVQQYLSAYNSDHDFLVSLYALLRLFEQRAKHANLPRLYEAQSKTARGDRERAAALIDEALSGRLLAQEPVDPVPALERALQLDEANLEAAMLLEYFERSQGASNHSHTTAAAHAAHNDDPQRRAIALCELSALHETEGAIAEARSCALEAVRVAPELEQTHVTAAALLRRHGPPEQLVDTLTRHARFLTGRPVDVDAFPESRRSLDADAAALWCEAARLSAGPLSAPGDALAYLKEASRLQPEDAWLHQLRMSAYDLLEDRQAAASEASALLALGATGRQAAGLHFRIAELALIEGDTTAARTGLVKAIECTEGSTAGTAMLEDMLFDEGMLRERLASLRTRESQDALAALRAGVAASELGDAQAARESFALAARDEALAETALREAYLAAQRLFDDVGCRDALDGLLGFDLAADERAALIHHRLALGTGDPETSEAGKSLPPKLQALASYLRDPSAAGWLPLSARIQAAAQGDWALLGEAHLVLAESSENPEQGAAHLCAAARAQLRGGDQGAAAAETLRKALELTPGHPYALALLQEALRAGGQQNAVVELLLQTAERQKSTADAELSMLLAGAAAEGAGDVQRAAQTYREATERHPKSVGPWWALLRLAQRTEDQALELRAREGLSRHERAQQQAGHETLLLAQHYDVLADQPERAAPELETVLENGDLGMYAAVDLLLLRGASPPQQIRALSALEGASREQRGPWARALGGFLQQQSSPPEAELKRIVLGVLAEAPEDRWAHLSQVGLLARGKPGVPAAEALEGLRDATSDTALSAGLRIEALRARRWGASPGTLDADLTTAGLGEGAVWGADTARVVLEELAPGSDPARRAKAHAARLEETTGQDRAASLRSLAAARLESGDASAATALLATHVEREPDDLAAWELLRVAARGAGRPELVAAACDRLRGKLEGELWAQLSEEAAAVRMDQLGEDAQAETMLREVLKQFPARAIAFDRLHDLLTERDDAAGLLALIAERLDVTDDPDDLIKLFYEQARLFRAQSQLDQALTALDNLRMLDTEHVAGLALAAEIHTSKQDWQGAVDALRELAQTDIPGAQRKLARLGAADYLEHKLDKPEDALNELLCIETEGLAGPSVFVRMADLYERAGEIDKGVRALREAASELEGAERADVMQRIGRLRVQRGDAAGALEAFQRALALMPADLEALEAVAGLCENPAERERTLLRFEGAVRDEIFANAALAAPYRKLAASARLRGDADLEQRATSALLALGVESPEERARLEAQQQPPRFSPGATLGESELATLLTPASDPGYRALSLPVMRAAVDADGLLPSRFGVGRGDRVSPRDPHALRDEIRDMLVAVGGELADFYVGGSQPGLVAAAPKGLATHFIVGVGVTTPLTPGRRHEIALHAAAARLGCLPLLSRDAAQAGALLHAAFVAGERALSPTLDATTLGELPRSLWKAASRRDRKAILEALSQLDDGGVGALAHAERWMQHVRRAALLLGSDLPAALAYALGGETTGETVAASEGAKDLMRAWLSPELGELRRKLGIAA